MLVTFGLRDYFERTARMMKAGTDSHVIQQAIDSIAQSLPASFILLRRVSFNQPEPILRAWTPNDVRPPLEITVPVSQAQHAVYMEQGPDSIEGTRCLRNS